MRRKTAGPWRGGALIVAAAFVVKLVVLLQLRNHPLLQPHGELDTAYYVALSQRVASEGVFAPIEAFFVSPLYVYFLAAVFAAGGSLLTAQLVQIGLGTAAVGLLLATARHWFGERAALVAAGLAILTGFFTFNEVLILQSALDPFLTACALYALTRTLAGGGTWAFAAAGTSLGLLALNRPNALVFAVAAATAVLVSQWRLTAVDHKARGPRPWRTRVTRATALVASLLTVLAANAARNYAVSGDAVVIASHGGLNLYIGNHDGADGTYTPVPGISPSIAGQARDAARVAESNTGRTLSPGQVSDYFTWRAIDWVRGHPADALRLSIRKVGILLNHVDVPLNYSYAFYEREPFSFLRVLAAGPWVILPFGLIGLFWPALRVNRRGYWVWAMFVPVYGAAVILFFVSDRYRMPLLVPLCATSGAALVRFFDMARARQVVPLLMPAGAAALAAVVVFANLGLDAGIGGEQTRKAVWFVEQGSFDEARRYVEQISNEHHHPGVLRFRVGQALLDAGRHEDAADLLARAITIDGPRPAIRLALGEALVGSGRAPEAVGNLEAAYDSGYDVNVAGPMLVRSLHASMPIARPVSNSEFGEDALVYSRCRFTTRLPTDRVYTPSHYWLREVEPGLWRVGLTAYGTRLLGEIVEYEFKIQPGTAVVPEQTIGWVEGFKTLSDLCSVAAGEFVAENAMLRGDITLLDSDPYERGWLYQVRGRPESSALEAQAYAALLNTAIDARLEGEL